jgi:hypothetical protein
MYVCPVFVPHFRCLALPPSKRKLKKILELPRCYFTFYTNMTDLKSMTDGRTSGGNDSVATYECSDGIVMVKVKGNHVTGPGGPIG